MCCGTAVCCQKVELQEASVQCLNSALVLTQLAFKIILKILLVFLKTAEIRNVFLQPQLRILCLLFSLCHFRIFCIAKYFSDFL